MKKQIPTWAAVAAAVVALALLGFFAWRRTSSSYAEKVVPTPYNPANPAGVAAPPGSSAGEGATK